MRQMCILMYIKGMVSSDFAGFIILSHDSSSYCEIYNDFCRIRVAAAAAAAVSSVSRPPSSRKLTGQKPAVS
jgi:hypothetical protein